jgi:hypothetical protein
VEPHGLYAPAQLDEAGFDYPMTTTSARRRWRWSVWPGSSPRAFEQALHARGDPREDHADLLVRRGRQRPELERPGRAIDEENAVEQHRVVVDIEIQAAPNALNHGHRSRPSVPDPVAACAGALKAEEHAHVHGEHGAR